MGSVKNMRVVAAVALRALPVGGPSIASAPPPAPLAAAGPSDAASASAVSSADNDVNPPALQRLTTPPPPPPAAAAAAAAAAKSWQSAAPLPTAQNRSTHADASIGTLHGTDHDGSLPPALLAAPASNDATDPLMNLPLMPFLPEASPASPAAGAAAATSSRNVLEPQDDALAGVLGAATKGLGAEHVGFVLMAPAAATGLGRLPATSLVALADSESKNNPGKGTFPDDRAAHDAQAPASAATAAARVQPSAGVNSDRVVSHTNAPRNPMQLPGFEAPKAVTRKSHKRSATDAGVCASARPLHTTAGVAARRFGDDPE
eukprot:TRINITY_DN228_c0_g1_i1.p1 TRINITY_DN228_c0_g1~~TRINITY_DN228_c0_g1_i1.p1  ORF type:complete len:318 (-),score=54.11 TRINITY_DN228_c0_g1_i1:27-980(-)